MFISDAINPTLYDVLAALLANSGKYVEFQYTPLPECHVADTPSKKAAKQDTVIPMNPIDRAWVRGFMATAGQALRMTKDGNFTLTLRNMNRKKKMPNNEGYYRDKRNRQENGSSKIGFLKFEYLYRSLRLDRDLIYGIDLASLTVSSGKVRRVRIFPNVAEHTLSVENRWRCYLAEIAS